MMATAWAKMATDGLQWWPLLGYNGHYCWVTLVATAGIGGQKVMASNTLKVTSLK